MSNITWTNDTRRLADLVPWEHNPKRMSKKQADGLRLSIERFGFAVPFLISPAGDIYDGHQRQTLMEAIAEYGPNAVVDVRVSSRPLTDDERRELVVRLKQNQAGWDFDMLPNLYEREELIEWGFEPEELGMYPDDEPEGDDPGPQIDRAEELREKWGVETGQLWQLGEHRLICGDCTDAAVVARVMDGERAGMVFIDPPYMTFGSSTGKLEPGDFAMLAPFWDIVVVTAQKNLDNGRAAFICCDWRSYPTLFNQAFKHMTVKNLIVWDLGGALKLGTSNFRTSYELIVYATNSSFGRNWKENQSGAWKIADRGERDLWTIKQSEAAPGINRDHVSQKPVELVERAIMHGSLHKEIVLDYFMGSGTTIVACENYTRRARCVEISPAYVAVALERWATMTGQEPVLLDVTG